jgi:SNF2 family DNA or RNA helicase
MVNVMQSKQDIDDIKLSFKYSDFFVSAVKKLPYRKYDPEDHSWIIHKNELKLLAKEVGKYNFQYESDELAMQFEAKMRAEKVENTKKRLEGIKQIEPFQFKTKPLPHQIEAFNRGISSNDLLIGDDMGLGKTMESLNIACYRKNKGQVNKCLIICGVNATKYNWKEEIEKHTFEKAMIFDQSSTKKKIDAINEWKDNDILFGIINIEALRPKKVSKKMINSFISGHIPVEMLPKCEITEALYFIDMAIADEIHRMKNATSKQGIALQQIDPVYKIGLSGTPLTNHIEDLWNIMTWLGKVRYNYWYFRESYCVMGGYNAKEVVGYKNLDQLSDDMNEIMLRRRKEEVLDLPEKLYQNEYVELKPETMKFYEEVEQGIVKKLMKDGAIKDITLRNALTIMLRLRQITEGLDSVDGKLSYMEDNPKLDRIKQLLEDEIIPNGKKAIIFTCWKTTANMYKEKLSAFNPAFITGDVKDEKRQQEVNRFQNDASCKIAIGTIGAMGTGYTMTAGEYVFFIDKYWNETDNKQAEDRAHRIGVKGNVTIISMIAKDTIDERVEKLLKEKATLFNTIIDGKTSTGSETESIAKELLRME